MKIGANNTDLQIESRETATFGGQKKSSDNDMFCMIERVWHLRHADHSAVAVCAEV